MQVHVRFRNTGQVLGTIEVPSTVMRAGIVRLAVRGELLRAGAFVGGDDSISITDVVVHIDFRTDDEYVDEGGHRERCVLVDTVRPISDVAAFTWGYAAVLVRAEVSRQLLMTLLGEERATRVLRSHRDPWEVIRRTAEWRGLAEAEIANRMNDDSSRRPHILYGTEIQARGAPMNPHPEELDVSSVQHMTPMETVRTIAENLNSLNRATRPQAHHEGYNYMDAERRILAAAIEAGNHGVDVSLVEGNTLDVMALPRHNRDAANKVAHSVSEPVPVVRRRRCLDLG